MDTKYGYFSRDEFIITTPDIPRNWYNYFYTDTFISFTSQAGIGQSFLQDNLGKRVTPVCQRGFYIYDGNKGWNLCGLPVYEKYDDYKCVHGIGYTKIFLKKHGIETEYGMFVPDDSDSDRGAEIHYIKAKNCTNEHKYISLFSYCENETDAGYRYQGYNTDTVDFDKDINGIAFSVMLDKWNGEKKNLYTFATGTEAPDCYDCARNAFVGPYNSVFDPIALHRGHLTNTACTGEKSGYSLQKNFELAPGEDCFAVFIFGVAPDKEAIKAMNARYNGEENINKALEKVKAKYEKICANVKVKTPIENLNSLVNPWLKYQTNMGSRWARVRHNGYRDIASDTECLASFNAPLAWERIKRLLTYQYSNGYAPRTFIDGEICDRNFSDCTVWLTFTVYYIICELGDKSLLEEKVPYNDGSVATVYEHLRASVDFLYNFRGIHNLIQIWGGDWNDCMNLAGQNHRGVSVWLSIAWYRACRQFIELARFSGRESDAVEYEKKAGEIRELVDKYGWDEKGYYIYAYDDYGRKIGASECEEGRIYLNPQTWAVLSGISYGNKQIIAMDMAEKELTYELGTAVSTPAYTKYDGHIGSMTLKAPGVQENGGVYLHSMCWKLAVDAMLKRPDRVLWDIEHILPFTNPVVAGRAEPYVLSNSYFGRETGYRYGTAGQSWRTASSQWFLKALVNYVFGLMPTFEGLKIDHCMPKEWSGAEIEKEFRNCKYHVVYRATGKEKITVEGKEVSGILPYKNGGSYSVEVEY